MAISKITYGNKSAVNTNSSVPAANKVQDSDMNEIKTVVNANADILGDGASLSGGTAVANINYLKGKKLWTNSSPTAEFAAQSITLSSSDYDLLEIFYIDYNSTNRFKSVRVPKGKNTLLEMSISVSNYSFAGVRPVTYSSATSLTVGACTALYDTNAFSHITNNTWCIPQYVIGYKTGLF